MQSNWDVIPWMVWHASNLISWTRKDNNRKTSYHKNIGRPFNKSLSQFCEPVFYLRPESLGKKKWRARWEIGLWLGSTSKSGEYIIGTNEGIIKVRTYNPMVEGKER